MQFMILVADPAEGDKTTTWNAIETNSDCARTNKRKLHEYLLEAGVKRPHLKRAMRELGFVGEALGK